MVNCTPVQALRLCTGRTAHRGSKGITLPFQDHDTMKGWGVSGTPRPLFTPGKDPVHIVQEAGWTPGPVWTGTENLAPTEIRSPDRPARSQSLYRLRYPAHEWIILCNFFFLNSLVSHLFWRSEQQVLPNSRTYLPDSTEETVSFFTYHTVLLITYGLLILELHRHLSITNCQDCICLYSYYI